MGLVKFVDLEIDETISKGGLYLFGWPPVSSEDNYLVKNRINIRIVYIIVWFSFFAIVFFKFSSLDLIIVHLFEPFMNPLCFFFFCSLHAGFHNIDDHIKSLGKKVTRFE